ncbi:MAG TPA: YbaB/EbfC family DNA-binding protein [Actinomadura sp.]|jgi:hypothetical protein|nr:YbaB/EbfC family DNA-binding protein [Actinomadura sp.]
MSHELGVTDLDRLLGLTRQAVDSTRTEDPPDGETPELSGEGFDADRQVRVVVVAGGRIDAIEVRERAMRQGSHEVAERVVVAVNAALADLESKTSERAALSGVDPAELTGRLREAQDLSVRQLRSYTRSLQDLMNGFERR